nr:SGNH hydrolase-type esterase domain-containing protein [Tanacetum cinerariifolium]
MKVIKEESEVLGLLEMRDDVFTCETPLGMIFDEFNRLSGMDDDLFTNKVGILGCLFPMWQFKDYMEIKRKIDVYEHEADMENDPSNVEFAEWLTLKFCNHLTMDLHTKNSLCIYWARRDDKVVLIDEELYDLEETNMSYGEEIAEFNYLFQIDVDVLIT